MLNNQLTLFDFNVDSVLHVAHLESFRWGSLACEKENSWRLEHAKPARIIGLGNARAKMFLALAHVSLQPPDPRSLQTTTVEPVLSGHPLLSGQFSKSRKLLLLMYCNFEVY